MDVRLPKVASVDPVADTVRATAPSRSLFARLFSDRDGELRTSLLVGLLIGLVALLSVGTYAGLLAANAGSPETLAVWAIGALILIKLPLLAVAWWIIARKRDPRGGGGWTSAECREILDYLETQARQSAGRPDAAARLAYFAREAWFVADSATDADTPAAVDTAVLIEAMASEAGAPVDRSRAAGRPGGPAAA